MSIEAAVLGMLSFGPMTGYEVKKIMERSSFLYWSGNNNQIYKALVTLHERGWVTSATHHQEGAPSKKVFTVTDRGLEELKRLSLAAPEAPEVKKPFLVQLATSWQLSGKEMQSLLDTYEQEIRGSLFMAEKEQEADRPWPLPTEREQALLRLIHENVADTYRQELSWIHRVRAVVDQYEQPESIHDPHGQASGGEGRENGMNSKIMERDGQKYLYLAPGGKPIETEQDGMELLSLCFEHGTQRLLIGEGRLSEAFYQLRTGVAGAVLQKFTLYHIKAAVLLDARDAVGKFREFLSESNRGTLFRSFTNRDDAERWLLDLPTEKGNHP